MNTFEPGESKTAVVTLTNHLPKAFNGASVLWLGAETVEIATSAVINFELASNGSVVISLPITLPTEDGVWGVYLDVTIGELVLGFVGESIETASEVIVVGRPSPCGNIGDVDGDGLVTMLDAQMIANYGNVPLTPAQLARADVNGDGVVTPSDAMFIAQYIEHMIDTFPACITLTEGDITISGVEFV